MPRTLAAYARPIRVRWGVGLLVAFGAGALEVSAGTIIVDHLAEHHRERHLDCRRPGASVWVLRMCLLHVLEALAVVDPTSTIELSMRMNFF